jgi:hypothetical protein
MGGADPIASSAGGNVMAASASAAYARDADSGDPIYAYKPSLLGAPYEFRLAEDGLAWRVGRHAGRIPYDDISRLRLSFRPVTLQSHRFVAEIWSGSAPKLTIASSSWRSMVEQERLDAAYAGFLTELHRRIAEKGARASFEAGSPPFVYWPGLVLFVVVSLALAALTVRALQAGATTGALFVAVFLAAFLWQAGTFFRRNRPGTYRPEAIPAAVLPRA